MYFHIIIGLVKGLRRADTKYVFFTAQLSGVDTEQPFDIFDPIQLSRPLAYLRLYRLDLYKRLPL